MRTALITAPTSEAITLDEAKAQCRIDHSEEDSMLAMLVTAAQQYVEDLCNRKFVTQTWDLFLEEWPDDEDIDLPFGSLQSVSAFEYTDTAGNTTSWTVSGSNLQYSSVTQAHIVTSDPYGRGEIKLAYGATWPSATLKTADPIRIRFTCGYGAAAAVPAALRSAILLHVEAAYAGDPGDNRKRAIHSLIQHYRLPW